MFASVLEAAAHQPVVLALSLIDKGALRLVEPLFLRAPVTVLEWFVAARHGELFSC